MNSVRVVGYTHGGSFYCSYDCLPDKIIPGSDEVSAVFANDEWDSYPICDSCNETCEDVGLTPDGFRRMEQDRHADAVDDAEQLAEELGD